MESDVLKFVLMKCKLIDMLHILKKWNFISERHWNEINFKGTKRDVTDKIVHVCKKNKLSLKNACDFHLIYTQLHSTNKNWTVYRLFNEDGDEKTDVEIVSRPEKLYRSLHTQLMLYLGDVVVNLNYYAGAIWGRVQLLDEKTPVYTQNSTIFFVAYPRTPYVMIPRIKARLLENFLQAITVACEADEIKDIKLTGCHVSSLAEIALSRHAQGSFVKYREKEEMENPLRKKSKKRKASDDGIKDYRIVNEEKLRKKRKLDDMNDKLGTQEPPTLEKLKYQINVNFRGGNDGSSGKLFKSVVSFEGTNVLDGIRNLVNAGLAKWPLPNHVCRVTSLAKNFIVLAEKPREQSISESDHENDKEQHTQSPISH